MWDSLSELRSSLCERRLERTALRLALVPVKTAQFTQFFRQVWRHTVKSLVLTESVLNWMCVWFPEWIAQFAVWKTIGKDSSEACAIACQNCIVYSVFPSGMTPHSKIARFNWECIAPFTPCVLVSVYERFCRQNTTVQETRTVIKPDSLEQIFKTCVSGATLDTTMIRPEHRFQCLR